MSLLRRLHLAIWKVVGKPIEKIDLWLLRKTRVGQIDGVFICDLTVGPGRKDDFLQLTREAMELIKSLDSRRYRRICRQFGFILNTPLAACANYRQQGKVCNVNHTLNFRSEDAQWNLREYASVLIHEATHGVILEKGIPYKGELRSRAERLCHREEYRFALHFEPGYADMNTGTFDPQRWQSTWQTTPAQTKAAELKRLWESIKLRKP